MLDDRKTAILSAVVQEYIATAQPVGSTHIADAPGVRVSSATVRNEMAVLEQEGYLVQPHTSAGRIPTDKGYRFFVDNFVSPGRLDQATRQQVGEFFRTAHGRLEEMLYQHVGPARPPDELRRHRRRPAGRGAGRAERAVRRAVVDARHRGRRPRQRLGGESDHRPRRRRDRQPPCCCVGPPERPAERTNAR